MWTETTEGRELIQEISMKVVTEIAPEELDLFEELMQEYFNDPNPPEPSRAPDDDPLGFGLSEVIVASTPVAAAMASAVLGYVITEVIKATKDEGATLIKAKVKALFSRGKHDEKSGSPSLTKQQLEQIKILARKQAGRFGIKPDLSARMADALIGSLALAQ